MHKQTSSAVNREIIASQRAFSLHVYLYYCTVAVLHSEQTDVLLMLKWSSYNCVCQKYFVLRLKYNTKSCSLFALAHLAIYTPSGSSNSGPQPECMYGLLEIPYIHV